MKIDLLEVHAKESIEIPEGYEIVKYETINRNIFKITFAKVSEYKSGKKKGKPKFEKKDRIIFTCSIQEHRTWEKQWSKKTDICYYCTGKGQTLKRVYKLENENEYRREFITCSICNGSGKCVE